MTFTTLVKIYFTKLKYFCEVAGLAKYLSGLFLTIMVVTKRPHICISIDSLLARGKVY